MDHILCHFEIPADDVEKLATFYTELFGWKITHDPTYGEYQMVQTSEAEGAVGGGMTPRHHPMERVTDYILVEDVTAYADKACGLGAQVIVPKTEVPGMGWFVIIMDPQHNVLGMFEPRM